MSREFPDWVNPWKAAEGKRIFSGSIPLKRMSRLAPLLDGVQGEASFTASFATDGEGRATVSLEVAAKLPLICQASLRPFRFEVSRRTHLAVIGEEANEEDVPAHYDPAVTRSGKLVFADLVEDELLLAMPQVPRDPELETVAFSTDPDAEAGGSGEDHYRPFAGLGEMLGGRKQESE
ncbi:MAG: DUF177 domain-containing protein [Xanthomonadales bacterium]|nr:DUF177 domain-containing protein [Xanthomonadales bacterium]NIX11786.1 DUF177 domain-containing protein [Xanthomonadales bacterium]